MATFVCDTFSQTNPGAACVTLTSTSVKQALTKYSGCNLGAGQLSIGLCC